jgi:hypothetical protein
MRIKNAPDFKGGKSRERTTKLAEHASGRTAVYA